jgi:catechol 2,3-dioxygenase-like lactoylglutathione lyase family enzyme
MDFKSTGDFAIHVSDISQARTFYRDKLGFRLIKDATDKLVFDTGKFTLYVNHDDRSMPFIPALAVKDYSAAKEYLQESGCEIVREWPGGKALYFRDPLGQLMDVIETK